MQRLLCRVGFRYLLHTPIPSACRLTHLAESGCSIGLVVGVPPRHAWLTSQAQTWLHGPRRSGSGKGLYYKIKSDGESRIHFAATNFHPVQGQSSLYHFYADVSPADGSITWHQSDGASILGALPHYTADATQVYDGSTVRCWVWDIAIDGAGNPRILGTRYPNNDGTDIRYMSWTWNGSTWVEAEITTDGQGLYSGEIYYAGGLCFDAADPNYVYLSAPVAGVREIQKWRTTDNGLSWTKVEDITSGSVGVLNARPYSPRAGEVLFWSGAYTTFTSYNTAVKRYGA